VKLEIRNCQAKTSGFSSTDRIRERDAISCRSSFVRASRRAPFCTRSTSTAQRSMLSPGRVSDESPNTAGHGAGRSAKRRLSSPFCRPSNKATSPERLASRKSFHDQLFQASRAGLRGPNFIAFQLKNPDFQFPYFPRTQPLLFGIFKRRQAALLRQNSGPFPGSKSNRSSAAGAHLEAAAEIFRDLPAA
jgi:hypothetical protein